MNDEEIIAEIKRRREQWFREQPNRDAIAAANIRLWFIRLFEYRALGKSPPFKMPLWAVKK